MTRAGNLKKKNVSVAVIEWAIDHFRWRVRSPSAAGFFFCFYVDRLRKRARGAAGNPSIFTMSPTNIGSHLLLITCVCNWIAVALIHHKYASRFSSSSNSFLRLKIRIVFSRLFRPPFSLRRHSGSIPFRFVSSSSDFSLPIYLSIHLSNLSYPSQRHWSSHTHTQFFVLKYIRLLFVLG